MKNILIAFTIVLSFIAGMLVKSNTADTYNVTYNYTTEQSPSPKYVAVPDPGTYGYDYSYYSYDDYDYSETGTYGEGYGYGGYKDFEDYLKNNPFEFKPEGPGINYTSDYLKK